MRARADAERVYAFAHALGRPARGDVTLYLTGGATAVVVGWRATTIVDIRIEPELDELLREVSALKERLEINVELASPLDFIPELPGWRDRSPFVLRGAPRRPSRRSTRPVPIQDRARVHAGSRGRRRDARTWLVERALTLELFGWIEPELYRFPAIDPPTLRSKVERVLG